MQQRVTLRLAHNLQLVTVRWFSRETKCSATAVWLSTAVEFISYLYRHTHTHTHTFRPRTSAGTTRAPITQCGWRGSEVQTSSGRWGEVRWGEVRWGRAAWKFGDTHTHVRTHTNSPADVVVIIVQFNFFLCEDCHYRHHSLNHLLPEHVDTHTHTLSPRLALPLLLYFCFFLHLHCFWWIPEMTEPPAPLLILPPRGFMSAWQTIGTGAHLPL